MRGQKHGLGAALQAETLSGNQHVESLGFDAKRWNM